MDTKPHPYMQVVGIMFRHYSNTEVAICSNLDVSSSELKMTRKDILEDEYQFSSYPPVPLKETVHLRKIRIFLISFK